MGYLSIAIGFLLLIVCSLRGVSVFVAGLGAAIVVMLMNGLPLTETIVGPYYEAFGGIFTTFFPIFLFGAILAKFYALSGAAATISDRICALLFRENTPPRRKTAMAFLAVIVSSAVLCYGGINSGVVIVTIYPIALRIFERADIPKRHIMGAICGGAFTFALCGPGTPQLTNVAGMDLGTSSTAGLVAGLAAILVEIAVSVCILSLLAERDRARGLAFAYGPKDVPTGEDADRPGFLVAMLPLLLLLVLFNLLGLHIIFASIFACMAAAVLFVRQLGGGEAVLGCLSEGASAALAPAGNMGSVVGFAAVVQSIDAFQSTVDRVLGMNLSPVLLLVLAVGFICALTGGSTTGFKIALPIISPRLLDGGMSREFIHRVGGFASTTFDSLPHSGAVIMAVAVADLKMRDAYPSIFVTTTVATLCGTAVTALVMGLFPMLP